MDNNYQRASEIINSTYHLYKNYKNSLFFNADAIPTKDHTDNNDYTKNYGFIDDDNKLFWIRIPKCANSYMRSNLFHNMNWRYTNLHSDYEKITSDYRGIVVLRDPYERWISGATTYVYSYEDFKKTQGSTIDDFSKDIRELRRYFGKNTIFKDIFVDWIINGLLHDFHGLPQSWYLYPANIKNCTFFYLHDGLGNDLNEYFNTLNIANTFNNLKFNNTRPNDSMQYFFTNFLDDESNKSLKTKIMDILRCDYELISSLNFYNK